jgi:hypothetical protein
MAQEDNTAKETVSVTCIFPNAALAKSFMAWMDNLGEQEYDDQLIVDDLPRLITAYDYEARTIEFECADDEDAEDNEYDPFAFTLMSL